MNYDPQTTEVSQWLFHVATTKAIQTPDDLVDLSTQLLRAAQVWEEKRDPAAAGHRAACIENARLDYGCDDINIDEDARLSETDYGTWVQAWVYLARPEEEEETTP